MLRGSRLACGDRLRGQVKQGARTRVGSPDRSAAWEPHMRAGCCVCLFLSRWEAALAQDC